MSRRIAYLFIIAGCAVFVAPAAADRECFDNICRMPEVTEAPEAIEALKIDVVPPAVAERTPEPPAAPPPLPVTERPAALSAPEPVRPQMAVDALPGPVLEPLARRPVPAAVRASQPTTKDAPRQLARPLPRLSGEPAQRPVQEPMQEPAHELMQEIAQKVAKEAAQEPARETTRAPIRPVEVVSRGPHYSVEPSQSYATASVPSHPGAGVVVVVPGAQYGEEGVALLQGRQDSSWQLCQSDRRDRRAQCGPYSYQPYGANGYRPYGSIRQYRVTPAYVYVPDARIVTIEPQN